MKYIVIDGVKYKVDPNDPSKPLLDEEGNKVVYVEDTPPEPPTPPAPAPQPKNYDSMTDEQIEELAKSDPALARVLRANRDMAKERQEADAEAERQRKADLEKQGEFQQLAKEAEEKQLAAEKKLQETQVILDKYKATVKNILDDLLSQIHEEKRSLVPQDSPRSQVEYIIANAKHLGVSIVKKGSHVPPNEEEPPIDDEMKDRKRFQELLEKEELTRVEQEEMNTLSKKIKEYDARRQN